MIRPASAGDARAFAAVITAAQATWSEWAPPAFTPYDEAVLASTWAERLGDPDTVAYAAETGGTVVAVAAAGPESVSHVPSTVAPDSAHLSTLFARPAAHGLGIAQRLHDHTLRALSARGYITCRLWVPAGATRARRFYARNGWHETGPSTVFAGLERLEARRHLGLAPEPVRRPGPDALAGDCRCLGRRAVRPHYS